MGKRIRGRCLIALAVVLAVTGAACGVQPRSGAGPTSVPTRSATGREPVTSSKTSTSADAGEALARAARTTSATSRLKFSVRYGMSMSRPSAGAGPRVEVSADGAYDREKKQLHVTVDLGGALSGLGVGGSETVAGPGVGQVEMIVDGDTAYLKAGALRRLHGLLDGKTWLRLPASDTAGLTSGFAASGQSDELLKSLGGANGAVTDVGQEDVRGTPTRHLRTTVDLARLAARVPGNGRSGGVNMFGSLGGLGKAPLDIWVDSADLVRRVHLAVEGPDLGRTPGPGTSSPVKMGALDLTIEYFDFGSPVDVAPPPPAEVIDSNDVGGVGAGGLFGEGDHSSPTTRPGG